MRPRRGAMTALFSAENPTAEMQIGKRKVSRNARERYIKFLYVDHSRLA